MLVDELLARRIRAAIALGGFSGVPALARELGPGWGQDTLYEVLNGKKEIPEFVVREIARLCQVPFAFFNANLDLLDQPPAGIAEHDQRVDEMAQRYDQQRAEQHAETMNAFADIRQDLSEVANALADLTQQLAEQAAQQYADERSARNTAAAERSGHEPNREAASPRQAR